MVQADFLDGLIANTILVQIIGSHFGIPGTAVELNPAQEPGSGLNKICYASCNDVLTRDQKFIGSVIGHVSDAIMQQIEACLKVVLELP